MRCWSTSKSWRVNAWTIAWGRCCTTISSTAAKNSSSGNLHALWRNNCSRSEVTSSRSSTGCTTHSPSDYKTVIDYVWIFVYHWPLSRGSTLFSMAWSLEKTLSPKSAFGRFGKYNTSSSLPRMRVYIISVFISPYASAVVTVNWIIQYCYIWVPTKRVVPFVGTHLYLLSRRPIVELFRKLLEETLFLIWILFSSIDSNDAQYFCSRLIFC